MTFKVLIFSITILVSFNYWCSCDNAVCPFWYSENVVPTVVANAPTTIAEVTFPCGATIETGKEMTLKQIEVLPKSITYDYNPTALYTIVMFDPDSPSEQNPVDAQYVQWLIVNLDGQSALSENLVAGDVLAPYETPLPESNSGKHRYIFLLFLQSCRLTIPALSERVRFNVETFASENSLGEAVAGNFLVINC